MTSLPLVPMDGFKFGCDPELFVFNAEGRAVSAAGLIPGTKQEPHPVEYGAVQVDGMAAEFNIDPVDNFEDFDRNITAVLKQLKGFLPKGHTLKAIPSVVFDECVWDGSPDEAKILGCTPDFNAWTGTVNPPPYDPNNPRLRTASGHLHIGWTDNESLGDDQHISNCRDLVKQLDWFLGGWSLRKDSDPVRRQMYGKAGACRYKPYGVEYRVLSNFWLKSRTSRQQVWDRMQSAIWQMSNQFFPEQVSDNRNGLLIQAINTSTPNIKLESAYSFPLKVI